MTLCIDSTLVDFDNEIIDFQVDNGDNRGENRGGTSKCTSKEAVRDRCVGLESVNKR